MGFFPLTYLAAGAAVVALVDVGTGARVALGIAWLYLGPPLLARLVLARFGTPTCTDAVAGDRAYRVWWLLTQIQMPFNRIGVLEELLRLVPGLYGTWLRLWGGRVSPFAFFARDVMVTERYLIEVGAGAVIGSYAGLVAHLVSVGGDGVARLTVAPVVVESGAVVGIRAGLGPGCRLAGGETLPVGRLLPPFTTWSGGRKHARSRPA
ncbi:MAG: hypothetical protein H6983_13865 [Ectothiorhodospiraceae bacterium]|nr:hypothetical protein [Ectothiorhodospiraceae bacterium]